MPPIIDTHCHLDLPAFADDIDAVIARATAAGVIGMLVPAIRPATWASCAALVERHAKAGMRLGIGVHPQIVPELVEGEIAVIDGERGRGARADSDGDRGRDDARADSEGEQPRRTSAFDIDAVAAWIAREAVAYRAIAIGECGLDGATADMPRQEALFRAHIRAARITALPLVIHVLRAHDLAPRVLREELEGDRPLRHAILSSPRTNEGTDEGDRPLRHAILSSPRTRDRIHGVLHSYSGGPDLVDVYRGLGMAFSFAGPVSYANARKPVEAARLIPDDLLLAETDAPDQAPEGHRSGRSEPAFVAAVITGLAAARGETAEEIAALTTANARRIFGSWE